MPQRSVSDAEGYRYAFQGQEKDPETGKEAFELRLWDSRIGRWLTTDPYGQYNSPYLGMGNDPISGVDPDGGYRNWFGAFLGWIGSGFQGSIQKCETCTGNNSFGILSFEGTTGILNRGTDWGPTVGERGSAPWSPLPGSIVAIGDPSLENFPKAYLRANASLTSGSFGRDIRFFSKRIGLTFEYRKDNFYDFSLNFDQEKYEREGFYNPFSADIHPVTVRGDTFGVSAAGGVGVGLLWDAETRGLRNVNISALIGDFNNTYHTSGSFKGQLKRSELGFNIGDTGSFWIGYNINVEAGMILYSREQE